MTMPGPATAGMESHLLTSIQTAQKQAAEIHSSLMALQSRLQPVMTPGEEPRQDDSAPVAVESPVNSEITNLCGQLTKLNELTQRIYSRLEV